jgi:hypothetical protein
MFGISRNRGLGLVAVLGSVVLAACAPKPAPPPPPPPPPKVVAIPPRPVAPGDASDLMAIPPRDAFGVRQTVNYRLTPAQTTWNLRSAFNVAALNCLEPRYEPIVVAYRAFLKNNAKKLTATTKTIDQEFRKKYGGSFRVEQDVYMTQVYNYFALPPALENFCDASLVMSQESLAVVPAELDAFSARWLPQIEGVYEQFFLSLEAYRIAAAQWDAQYGAIYGEPKAQPVSLTVPQPAPAGTATYGPTTNRRR